MSCDDYTLRQLMVYKTVDGGNTWENINLWIPEEYEGIIAPPCDALSPGFDVDHGVMLVTFSVHIESDDTFESRMAWFETFDGGESWTFHIG